MSFVRSHRTAAPLAAWVAGTLALVGIAYSRAGTKPALSVIVAEIGALISLLGLVALGKALASSAQVQAQPRSGTSWLLVVSMIKLPFVLGCLYLAVRLAGSEPVPLILAVVLVYCCFVWLVARLRV